ncbi:MAG: hypothetical protein L0Z51_05535 [Candidatus Latescibacteria bacterium]|nr:hypothetical protein [Candidatus Latescibacterota bacterium]
MADSVQKVDYCYATVSRKPGQGAEILAELAKAGINLDAFSGFPRKKGRAQLDLVTTRMPKLRRVAAKSGWKVSPVKKAFLITGVNKAGAVHYHVKKLADAGISITAADAVCAGMGRYGMILWVKPRDYAKAAKALKAK